MRLFTLVRMRIRIMFLIKVIEPATNGLKTSTTHFEPLSLHCERLRVRPSIAPFWVSQLQIFNHWCGSGFGSCFAFHSVADLVQASCFQNDAYPCGFAKNSFSTKGSIITSKFLLDQWYHLTNILAFLRQNSHCMTKWRLKELFANNGK